MAPNWSQFPGPAGSIACWTQGSESDTGLPVFFIHPINIEGACWLEVVRLLGSRPAIMPDLRGHGGSSPTGPFGLDEWSADCVAVMDHFGIDRAHFVGGSLGGPIAVNLASQHPDRVASIASFGGALTIEGDEAEAVLQTLRRLGPKGMFRSLLPEISVGPDTDPVTMEWILALTNPNDVDTVYAIWSATLEGDITDLAAAVSCPVLVSNGEYDKTCTPEQGLRMAAAFGTKLRLLPGVGHLPMCESPGLVAFLVNEHIYETEEDDQVQVGTGDTKRAQ